MKTTFSKFEWAILLMLIVPFIYVAYIWNQLPAIIPTHFDINGKPNGYSSKAFGTLLMPCINVAIYGVLLFIPRIDPRYKNYAMFQKSYQAIRLVLHIFLTLMAIIALQTSLTGSMFSIKLIAPCIFLMLAFLGNYLRTVRPNFFVGIRTPWTLSNDEVWKKTHQLGGRILFTVSIMCFVLSIVLPMQYGIMLTVIAIPIALLIPVVYSYMEYKKMQKNQ